MASNPDHLSGLPDDVLQRILRFVPAKEAASTAALSRRWRGLWPTPAGAVVLDTRSYGPDCNRGAFFRGAEAALAAHGSSVRSLSVHVEAYNADGVEEFISRINHGRNRHAYDGRSIAGDVLGHRACRGVEELSVSAALNQRWSTPAPAMSARYRALERKHEDLKMPGEPRYVGCYKLSLSSVPSAALRELHIDNCNDLTLPPPATATTTTTFPCLVALRLQRCVVSLFTLRAMIAASPQLATLRLEGVYFTLKVPSPDDEHRRGRGYGGYHNDEVLVNDRVETLSCGTGVATLVVLNCSCTRGLTIELDMPGLQSFRYRGHIDRFKLKSPLPDVQRADLHFVDDPSWIQDTVTCQCFWLFIKNLCKTKFLKLKLGFALGDIAIAGKKRRDREILSDALLRNLERLEVDGQYIPGSAVAVTVGNLLQCCPVVRDLRLKLNTVDRDSRRHGRSPDWRFKSTSLKRKSDQDARKSVDHFARRRNLEVCLGGEGDHGDPCEAADIPGLSDKWFNFDCLRGSLRRVRLQFRTDKSSRLGTQLVKFFAERTVALEEMYIDDGNRKMCEHINRKVGGRSTANTSTQPCSEYEVSKGASQLSSEHHAEEQERGSNCCSTRFRVFTLER